MSKIKWIPCSERMPKEHEWIGTKKIRDNDIRSRISNAEDRKRKGRILPI